MILDNCRELCLVEMRPIKTVNRHGNVRYLIAIQYIGESLPMSNQMNWSVALLRDARREMLDTTIPSKSRLEMDYDSLFLQGESDIYTGLYYLSELIKKNNIQLTGKFKLDTRGDIQDLTEKLLLNSMTLEEYAVMGKNTNVVINNCGVTYFFDTLLGKGDNSNHPYLWGRYFRRNELLIKDIVFCDRGGSTMIEKYEKDFENRERNRAAMEDGYVIRVMKDGVEMYISGILKDASPSDTKIYMNEFSEMALTYREEDVALMDIQDLYDSKYGLDALELKKVSGVNPDTIPMGSRETSMRLTATKTARGV